MTQELQNTGTQAMATRQRSDVRGTEHITKDDVQMPRLVLAQKMSPETDESDARCIKGLKPGDLFNGLPSGEDGTHTIYGRGPLTFQILRADPPRWVEFIPREQGGGVRDFNVPAGDPRTEWHGNEKPAATKFYDFVIRLQPEPFIPEGTPEKDAKKILSEPRPFAGEIVALSFKSTGIKIAKQLNALIKLRNKPIFDGRYRLISVDTQNTQGRFAILNVSNAGRVSEEDRLSGEEMFEALRNRDLNIQRDEEEEVPFEVPEGGSEGPIGQM